MSCFCCVCTESGKIGVVQMFGEFTGTMDPGFGCIPWPLSNVTSVPMALQQLHCKSEVKTKDNVTMSVITAVQYRINRDNVKTAVFDIVEPEKMMRAEVDSILRSTLPSMDLDEAYEAKEKMNSNILGSVRAAMDKFGYDIRKVLITDLLPERSILNAMNEINAAKRNRQAAFERGEADKVLKIKASEADAEAKRLAGVGMASMRAAIAQGMKDSIGFMKESGMSEGEAQHMMIMTQYLDTLKEFANSKSSIMVPHGPSAVSDIAAQIRDGFANVHPNASPGQQDMGSPKTGMGRLFG